MSPVQQFVQVVYSEPFRTEMGYTQCRLCLFRALNLLLLGEEECKSRGARDAPI